MLEPRAACAPMQSDVIAFSANRKGPVNNSATIEYPDQTARLIRVFDGCACHFYFVFSTCGTKPKSTLFKYQNTIKIFNIKIYLCSLSVIGIYPYTMACCNFNLTSFIILGCMDLKLWKRARPGCLADCFRYFFLNWDNMITLKQYCFRDQNLGMVPFLTQHNTTQWNLTSQSVNLKPDTLDVTKQISLDVTWLGPIQ